MRILNDIEIERYILIPNPTLIEFHAFVDTSEAANGAVIYCKSRSESGEIKTRLITSKSRVSTVKKVTISRLAVLLAKLMS